MKRRNLLMSTAMAGLMMASCSQQAVGANSDASSKEVMCYGVNACKGHGDCSGKIDACNGKNGCEASLKCAGMNSCKGKGLKKLSKKECMDKGGKVAS
ncbi:MAG: hypothetical protein CME63_09505 [Halobacteriovoraceae bacterium]|nr:hypothetical protein [Halobacteriovoraceae bacterium]MBC97973.1 hypothetical protein [Halobacteriovoraceae bacterium]|tara:strand:+ start:180414 stop:180707 length:294 start_codon:yes stop_codon:yes gene_type:complete